MAKKIKNTNPYDNLADKIDNEEYKRFKLKNQIEKKKKQIGKAQWTETEKRIESEIKVMNRKIDLSKAKANKYNSRYKELGIAENREKRRAKRKKAKAEAKKKKN